MINIDQKSAKAESGSSDVNQVLLRDIGTKWPKFSTDELAALRNKDELVAQLATKYSIDKTQARTQVDALMNGRQFGAASA